jgi:group I intron endonuclease
MADAILCASGIYAIRNTVNGKVYVGSAANIEKRWRLHRSQLALSTHHSKKLQNAWNKHGSQSFVFEVIELVNDKSNLLEREQHWIDTLSAFSNGYNGRLKAQSYLGMKHSTDALAKMSAKMMGNSYGAGSKRSLKQLEKMSEAGTGKRHSVESRQKISASRAGFEFSDEAKAKISLSLMGNQRTLGYTHSVETKRKVSESLIGNKRALGMRHTQEAREKMSQTRRGRKLSLEVRMKMSVAQRDRRAKELLIE